MVGTDFRYLRYFYRIVAVMTGGMMRVRDADLRIRPIALLARELECNDPREIRLKGENLQVEHELGVVGERWWNTDRPIQIGRLVVRHRLLAPLDLALYLAHALEILIQARAIRGPHSPFDPGDVRSERI